MDLSDEKGEERPSSQKTLGKEGFLKYVLNKTSLFI